MIEYFSKAFAVWSIGFFPLAEIYVAVPAGVAMGLDPVSVVVWSVTGNYLPILLIEFGYEQIRRIPRVGPWLDRLASPKVKAKLDRHGFWFLVLATPWIGVWIVAATAKLLGVNPRMMLAATFLGVLGYAIVLVLAIGLGIDAIF